MELPIIPLNPKEWDIKTIEKLIKIPQIESEKFDFKRESNELNEHICSMANSGGGIFVLGISEIKSKDGKRIIRFKKIGFTKGKEETIQNQIMDNAYGVEPLPKIEIEHIHESNRKKFYTVFKIIPKISDKPYFVKSTDQCFIRLHNSKRRATRALINELFSTKIEQRKNLERLRSSLIVLKHEIIDTMERIRGFSTENQTRTAPVDLSFVRNFVIENESYLTSNMLLGNRTGDTISDGIVPVLRTVEILNEQVKAYNSNIHPFTKSEIRSQIVVNGYMLNTDLNGSKNTIDKIISKIDDYLSEFN